MPTLLINNNNSRTKFAIADGDQLSEHRAVKTHSLTNDVLTKTLADLIWDHAIVASVVPEVESTVILPWLESQTHQPAFLSINHETTLGVAVDFPHPETIGADRLANAAAVVTLLPDAIPAVVVDFGTAVTFDIIARTPEKGPAYVGGVIAPGLDLMRDYLHQRTALLPKIDLEEPPAAIGKSTIDAMLAGAVHGYRGLVREILAQITEELKRDFPGSAPPKLIATGGYADLIARGLPEIDEVCPHFTLDGLRVIADLNFPDKS